MCGVAGILSSNTRIISKQKIERGISCLRHRGPEGAGVWINQESTTALGHRRLSIIDPSPEAAQPFHYLERYTIVHNGELYNYTEIKEELLQKGSRFTTSSDTEVIVAAYAVYGEECLKKFDGMFAFAIWDEKEKKLFAARDRFGEKPFFFYYDQEQFVFASELKTLWMLGITKEVNAAMLYNFITIGYTGNPADPQETFYDHVQKLPAACFLNYSVADHSLSIEKYWQIYPEVSNINEDDGIEKFVALLNDSVRKRLRSDVPIGTSLSGGLDSSSIVAICDDFVSGQYSHKCFTAAFKNFGKNELRYAEAVAKKYGLQHHIIEINEADIVQLMTEVMRFQEEPFSSASPLAQYSVFQSAKQNGVTVLLDGQGADETLAGYHKYYKWYWQELYRSKNLGKSAELKNARDLGITESFSLKNKLAAMLPEFSAGILQTKKSKQAFQHPDLNRDFAYANKRNLYYSLPTGFDLNGALYFNSFVSGLEELLRLADRNSMAHATEVRLPFLSHELVEFLFTLPPGFKIKKGWTKWLLRKSMETKLPQDIVWRKDKVGFEPPQEQWMKNKNVEEAIIEAKKKLVSQNILNASVIHKKIKPHSSYAADNSDWKYWSAAFLF